MADPHIILLVSRVHVKIVKSALEIRDCLDRTVKITEEKVDSESGEESTRRPCMVIPTTISWSKYNNGLDWETSDVHPLDHPKKEEILNDLGLGPLGQEISLSTASPASRRINPTSIPRNPVIRALSEALAALPEPLLASLDLTVTCLVSSFPETYSVYKPLLLLPAHAFSAQPWAKLLAAHPSDSPVFAASWLHVAKSVGTTHVAMNAGIPPKTHSIVATTDGRSDDADKANILRSPVNLTPVYGSFGPAPTPQTLSCPTPEDFAAALWVTSVQNGIHQIWAPLYTMFSRGNIREKTRLLTHPSVLSAVSEGKGEGSTCTSTSKVGQGEQRFGTAIGQGSTAVDLYAGIGYFAFSYKRAGISKVLCWELNPWSIDGLVRGAKVNGWSSTIFTTLPDTPEECQNWASTTPDADFLIFQQSNEEAIRAISQLAWEGPSQHGRWIPPIRHVNCGFLPTSQRSWPTAVRVIDSRLGGWIHAHENVGVHDIETRKEEIVLEMQRVLDLWDADKGTCGRYRKWVRCEHVERVKTYAPGVVHVVFDIWVDGDRDAEHVIC
ncbi:hypothetical protein K504DRAFT_463608 [Pleomassaria siparia CBS 279.74]|uniref:tRNA(Phe) (4-demethylwyosine(37)-C(7)) aminocarboxypropyltransferase n=1 Tax=Pleomassaria siparia CBS 279.74 TaxID=1314801 RepID=A0A6G1JSL5_9PLEO|nr:hypothetical protein K504DRAFT_463608 [Pleomassaria siparia CBS 279.74]